MPINVNLTAILQANSTSPKFSSKYPLGNRQVVGGGGARQFAAGYFMPAKYPLNSDSIVTPRPDNETHSMSYVRNAHVGMQYELNITVFGGAYPHYFDVISAPVGATLGLTVFDADYGVLKWTPSSTGSNTFSIRVTDQDGSIQTRTWTVNVSADAFRFVSPTGSNAAAGTIAAPWQTLAYALDNTTGGRTVVLRAGTYAETMTGKTTSTALANAVIGYNGETVSISGANMTYSGQHGVFMVNSGDFMLFNLRLINPPAAMNDPRWSSSFAQTSRAIMDKCYVDIANTVGVQNFDNISVMFMGDAGSTRKHISQTRNTFTGWRGASNGWSAFDTYDTQFFVHEGNTYNTQNNAAQVGVLWAKGVGTRYMTIRRNEFLNPWSGIISDIYLANSGADYVTGDIEICYNKLWGVATQDTANLALAIGRSSQSGIRSPVYSYRNTIKGNFAIYFRSFAVTVSSEQDVVVTDALANGVTTHRILGRDTTGADWTWPNPATRGNITLGISGTECHGNTGAGILDASLNLTGASATNWAGKRGWQVSSGSGAATGTITSAGAFGTKNGTSYYENFETQTAGAVAGNLGSLNISTITGVSIDAALSHSGTKSLRHDFEVNDFPKIYKDLAGTARRIKLSCWLYFSGATRAGGVWKLSRAGRGAPYSGDPAVKSAYTCSTGATIPANFSGEIVDAGSSLTGWSAHSTGVAASTAFTSGGWMYYECLTDWGTVDGNDCKFIEKVNGKTTISILNKNILTSGNPGAYANWFMTPMCGLDGAPTAQVIYHMDELLIEEDWTTVTLTNNATYSLSTKWAAQPISSWSNDSVTYKKRRGGFSIGETAYVHVTNSSGALVYSGSSFIVGADD